MSDSVQYFIFNFCQAIKEGLLPDIQNMYENTFPQITDHYFDDSCWPEWKEVAELVDHDKKFSILYKELYYRHLHSRVEGGPTLDERICSFYNYCDFFNTLLTARKPVQLNLPDIWLWELVDEFIYQFQTFSRYRSYLTDKSEEEVRQLFGTHSSEWSILCILNVLHSLTDISDIHRQLKVIADGLEPKAVAGEFGRLPLYKMLGYFAIVGLARVHAQLGDYFQVVKVLEPLGVHKILEYASIPACQITVSYYVGFSFMMMRRYVDAISIFSDSLIYTQTTKQSFSSQPHRNEIITKQSEQMYHLLAICMVLQPVRIDESLQNVLREKDFQESIVKMQSGDLEVFEQFFLLGCPIFVNACPPTAATAPQECSEDLMEQQLDVFLQEVRQQINLPTLRSFLKLYTTLPLSKLKSLVADQGDERSEEEMLTDLLCFKHKMHNVIRSTGATGLEVTKTSVGELDFFVDEDMIHIVDSQVTHGFNDFFLTKCLQLNEMNRRLAKLKM